MTRGKANPLDLRIWLEEMRSTGELKDVIGADWNLELGAISELNVRRDSNPALLFDEVVGYPKGFRVLTSTHDSIPATRGLLNYSREQKSPRILGNIFTTWGLNRATWTMRNGEKHYPLPEFPPIVAGLELLLKNGKPGK